MQPEYCLFLKETKCKICSPVCKQNAIDFKQKEEESGDEKVERRREEFTQQLQRERRRERSEETDEEKIMLESFVGYMVILGRIRQWSPESASLMAGICMKQSLILIQF